MGSPVSAAVANLRMEIIEEQARQSAVIPPKVWKRFLDDSLAIIKRSAVLSFHNTLNAVDPHTKKTTPSPEELVRTFFESVERTRQHNGYAVLP